jgi:ADP-ribose pyrophosphatase
MSKQYKNPWKTLSEKEIYQNPWIRLTEAQVINPGGGKGIYGKIHFRNLALGIVALDENHHTWLVGQYRYVPDQFSWEIPEGGGPIGTDPLNSAKRELLEETGISAASWTEIQRLHLSNSVSDELAIIYLARDLEFGEAHPEETEELSIWKLPFDEAYKMVLEGEITDSMSVAAILKVKALNIVP